jgi:hypothetical protein
VYLAVWRANSCSPLRSSARSRLGRRSDKESLPDFSFLHNIRTSRSVYYYRGGCCWRWLSPETVFQQRIPTITRIEWDFYVFLHMRNKPNSPELVRVTSTFDRKGYGNLRPSVDRENKANWRSSKCQVPILKSERPSCETKPISDLQAGAMDREFASGCQPQTPRLTQRITC